MGRTKDEKALYFAKFKELVTEHKSFLIVNVDNVGSNQMHQVRQSLRNSAQILMGKNTMVRRAIKNILSEFPQLEKVLSIVKGNIGFIFTNDDLKKVKEAILNNVVAAPARAGAIAPVDVWIPAGNTGMEPGKTSFFQALNIPTKIARGTIEIVSDIHLVAVDAKVGPSEATLLNMLNISPFTYGMKITSVYSDGQIFDSKILDIEEDTLISLVQTAIANVASLSLAANFPTIASVTHTVINSYKNLLAVALATNVTFEGAERAKAYLENPGAFAVTAAPVESSKAATESAQAPVEEEESDEDMGLDLFG